MGSTSHQPLYDVVIIGAGLAGLAAAVAIQEKASHLSYLVLEARDRVGGKTLSTIRPDGKGKQELGAAWINDTNQSRMWELAQEFGMVDRNEIVKQNVSGDVAVQDFAKVDEGSANTNEKWVSGPGNVIRFPYGSVPEYADEKDTKDCLRVRDLVEKSKDDIEMQTLGSQRRRTLDSMSFEEWLWDNNVGAKGRSTAKVWTHAMLGVDPSEVSALYFLDYCRCGGGLMTMRGDGKNGGQYLRMKGGTSEFAQGLKEKLRLAAVMFDKPVVGINCVKDAVWVQTKDGEKYCGRHVIVSIPTPVYKTITWNPPLASEKSGVADRTRYGCYTKYILLFSKPFWRDAGFCGLSQSFLGPVSVTRDTCVDDEENFAMTCFIGGVFGRRWSGLTQEDKKSTVLKQLGAVFAEGRDITSLCLDAMESPWIDEEWNGWGCPCAVMQPGVMEDGKGVEALRKTEGRLHFVGTEMADVWRGYMEGAVRSGESGGLEVMEDLKKEH